MGKEAHRFLEVERNAIREKGFHEERALAAESLFSLSDEFMGSRGYFEEGYSGKSLAAPTSTGSTTTRGKRPRTPTRASSRGPTTW